MSVKEIIIKKEVFYGMSRNAMLYFPNEITYPANTFIGNNMSESPEVNNYNKWIQDQIRFTTPNADELIELDKQNKNITIDIRVRGVNVLKIKDFTLISVDGSHEVDTNKGTLDVAVRENKKSITVFYQGSIDIKFGYIDPLKYKDQMDLRDYLKALCSIYGVSPTRKLRTLVNNQSYLMASDYNDMKDYCIEIFTLIQKKYPYTFDANLDVFNALPVMKAGDSRGPSTFSSRGKHYFPEWDDLIDAIAGTFFKQTNTISSTECVTWSSHTEAWIRYNQSTFLKTSDSSSTTISANSISTTNAAINIIPDNATTHFCSAIFSLASRRFSKSLGLLNNITIPKKSIGTNKTATNTQAFQ